MNKFSSLSDSRFEAKKRLLEETSDFLIVSGKKNTTGFFSEFNDKKTSGADYNCAVAVLSFALLYNFPCVIYKKKKDIYDSLNSFPQPVIDNFKDCVEIFYINANNSIPYRLVNICCPVVPKPDKLYGTLSLIASEIFSNNKNNFEQKKVKIDKDFAERKDGFCRFFGHNYNIPTMCFEVHTSVFSLNGNKILAFNNILYETTQACEEIFKETY